MFPSSSIGRGSKLARTDHKPARITVSPEVGSVIARDLEHRISTGHDIDSTLSQAESPESILRQHLRRLHIATQIIAVGSTLRPRTRPLNTDMRSVKRDGHARIRLNGSSWPKNEPFFSDKMSKSIPQRLPHNSIELRLPGYNDTPILGSVATFRHWERQSRWARTAELVPWLGAVVVKCEADTPEGQITIPEWRYGPTDPSLSGITSLQEQAHAIKNAPGNSDPDMFDTLLLDIARSLKVPIPRMR
jgi:hypothetical protein